MSLHPAAATVGLGLVRLEFADRAWWAKPPATGATVQDYLQSEQGRLSANVGGTEWGVFVGKGEAYAAACKSAEVEAAP